MARTFYRIVATNPPTLADFLSDQERGRATLEDRPEVQRLRTGRSVYATLAQARRKTRSYPFLGSYIAAVAVADESPLRVERTLRSSPGHHTVWGDAELLLASVLDVVTI